MQHWRVTAADRDEEGKIRVTPHRTLADLLPASAATAAPVVRRWERDAAMLVSGLLIGVALFALIGRSSPAPAAPRPPLAVSTAAPTAQPTMTATVTPTATPQPSAAGEATKATIFAPPPTPCDPLTAPYQVKEQVFPIGSVVGASCTSAEEAQANAGKLAAAMIATATAEARPKSR
jgi:hypothetical protein